MAKNTKLHPVPPQMCCTPRARGHISVDADQASDAQSTQRTRHRTPTKQRRKPTSLCGRGGGIAVRKGQIQLRKIAEKLRCRNQTSRSLKEQHFCTRDTQGTYNHARWTSKKQLRKIVGNSRKWRNCEKLRKIADLNSPPSPLLCGPLPGGALPKWSPAGEGLGAWP